MADSGEESGYEDFTGEKKRVIKPGSMVINYKNELYTKESWRQLKAEKIEEIKNQELHRQEEIYKKMHQDCRFTVKGKLTKDKIQPATTFRRCFNCHNIGHERSDCPHRQTEKFCYVCGKRGYTRKDCTSCKNEYKLRKNEHA